MIKQILLISVLSLAPLSAHAEAEDLDLSSIELLDVLETVDGTTWTGVVVEQTPDLYYKIATATGVHVIDASEVVKLRKQWNPDYLLVGEPRFAAPGAYASEPIAAGARVSASYDGGTPRRAPGVRSGLRLDPEIALVFPRGDLADGSGGYRETLAPGVRFGYEAMTGTTGLSVGGHVRFISWRESEWLSEQGIAHWTLETQLYGRAAAHIGSIAPYAGVSVGLDTNHFGGREPDQTNVGLGMNLQAGVHISASEDAAIDLGVDYHPGTDRMIEAVSYLAFRVGASVRL